MSFELEAFTRIHVGDKTKLNRLSLSSVKTRNLLGGHVPKKTAQNIMKLADSSELISQLLTTQSHTDL